MYVPTAIIPIVYFPNFVDINFRFRWKQIKQFPMSCSLRKHTNVPSDICTNAVWLESLFKGLDKSGFQVNIFLISPRKHMLWYSLEAPHQGASNEYPQHIFLWRNKKDINTFGMKKASYQELCLLSMWRSVASSANPKCAQWRFWSDCTNVQAGLKFAGHTYCIWRYSFWHCSSIFPCL